MIRLAMSCVVLLAAGTAAFAEGPSPTTPSPGAAPAAASTAPAAASRETAKADGSAASSAGDATATDQTYKMKDGGMYQPPAQRPASPAMDLDVHGRT